MVKRKRLSGDPFTFEGHFSKKSDAVARKKRMKNTIGKRDVRVRVIKAPKKGFDVYYSLDR